MIGLGLYGSAGTERHKQINNLNLKYAYTKLHSDIDVIWNFLSADAGIKRSKANPLKKFARTDYILAL